MYTWNTFTHSAASLCLQCLTIGLLVSHMGHMQDMHAWANAIVASSPEGILVGVVCQGEGHAQQGEDNAGVKCWHGWMGSKPLASA